MFLTYTMRATCPNKVIVLIFLAFDEEYNLSRSIIFC